MTHQPTQASLDAWAAGWLKTAETWRAEAAYERRFVSCSDLPSRIRRQAKAAAERCELSAIECAEYARSGIRF